MIKHTFFDKCNTIIKDSEYNTGLNPVAELNAGDLVTRILIYVNLEDLKTAVLNGEMDVKNLTHTLKMKNCGSVNLPLFNDTVENNNTTKKRADSFDIIVYKLPYLWDEGRGFDYHGDLLKETHKVTSKNGSNWYQARNGMNWDEEGIYSVETLNANPSLIVGRQHFDSGVENFEIDITEYINNVLSDNLEHLEEYHGLGIAFEPRYEKGSAYEIVDAPKNPDEYTIVEIDEIPLNKINGVNYLKQGDVYYKWKTIRDDNRFISFFTNHTNTFFHPYLETVNNDIILDDRAKFHLGVENRLYFFVTGNEGMINLDEMPTCTINDKEYEVKQGGKGTYYALVSFKRNEVEPDTILTDIWGNIVLNGEKIDDIEMDFVVLPFENKVTLGKRNNNSNPVLVPQISGIGDNEKIKVGDTREVKVDFIEEYSYGKKHIPSSAWYRIYVKEGNREIDVYPYHPIERKYDEHFFYVDSMELIPNEYHVDIMIPQNGKAKYYENCLEFTVVDNVTNYYL